MLLQDLRLHVVPIHTVQTTATDWPQVCGFSLEFKIFVQNFTDWEWDLGLCRLAQHWKILRIASNQFGVLVGSAHTKREVQVLFWQM